LFLTGIGRNRQLAVLASAGALVNLAGSIGATYWLGPVGPAVGSVPVVLVIDFIVLPVIVCRYLGVSRRRYLRNALTPVVPAGVVAGAVALALVHLHPAHSGLAAIVGAGIVVGLAWITLLLVVSHQEPELRQALRQRLRDRRARRG
jgi:hypothetical protein